jgi:NAD(P)-dependent dehydrogenase (short-subunit alcohol dehydrogenase family)
LHISETSEKFKQDFFAMGWFSNFLYSQLFVTLPIPESDFSGQTVIITGSNIGLGLEAARHVVRLNAAKVILAVRDVAKGASAAKNISSSTNSSLSVIEVWKLDLSSSASVKAFSARVQGLDRLDAMIENAGIMTEVFTLAEGTESIITVNVVNTVLLGLLVLPKLRQSAERYGSRGRLAFVGSDLQMIAKFNEQNVPGPLMETLNSKEAVDMSDR